MTPLSRQHLASLAVHDVVTADRLRAGGVTKDALRHLVRSERLFRQHRGVFSLAPALTAHGRWFAAVAACGDGAALSHLSAAALWSLTHWRDHVIEVTVPRSGGRRDPAGLRVHRTRRPDSTRRDRIEVTTLHRTIDDCAHRLARSELHRLLRQAEFHHRLDVHRLGADATSHALKALLAAYVAGEGIDARRGRRARGARAHARVQDDKARDRALKISGWEVVRFTWSEVVTTPAVVVADLKALLRVLPRVQA